MNITEFRKQYPQYASVDDDTLTKKLHSKYYSDTPFETFAVRFREPEVTPDLLDAARRALTSEPKVPAPLREEARHAIGRGGIKAAASVPGTLAALIDAGSRMPGAWYPRTSEVVAGEKETVRRLRKKAAEIYRTADVPSLTPTWTGPAGFVINAAGETVPVLAASAASSVLGPVGPLAVGTVTGGEMVAQEALKAGATPEQSETERWIAGPVMGLLERLQADEILKVGKSAVPALIVAARKKLYGEMAKSGGKLAARQAIGAAAEGLEEGLQQTTQIGAATIHGEEPLTRKNLEKVLTAFVGGAAVGGPMKAVLGVKRGLGELGAAVRETPEAFVSPFAEPENVSSATAKTRVRMEGDISERPTSVDTLTQEPPAPAEGSERPFTIRNEAVAERADKMGLMPLRSETPETRAQWMAEALAQDIPGKAPFLAEEIMANPRPLTGPETMGFQVALDAADAQWVDASNRMRGMKDTDLGYTAAKAEANEARSRYDIMRRATKASGRKSGQSLGARAGLAETMNDDASELSVLSRGEVAKGGKLTEAEETQFAQDAQKVQQAQKELDQIQQQAVAKEIGLPTAHKPRRRRSRARRQPRAERYAKMSEVEKDAELQDLLKQDTTDSLVLTRIAENIASRPEVKTFEDVINRAGTLIPGTDQNTIIDAVAEGQARQAQQVGAMTARFRELLKGPAKKNKALDTNIRDILYWLEHGELPPKTERVAKPEAEINRKLREIRDILKQMQQDSLPAESARLDKQIAFLEARIANEDYGPRPQRQRPAYDKELWQKRVEVSKLRSIIHERFERLRPRTAWGKIGHTVRNLFQFQQALRSNFDDSAFGNQGRWMVVAHPIRSIRVLPWTFKALRSDAVALSMQAEIENRPNAWMDVAYGLDTRLPVTGQAAFTHGEEILRTTWMSRIPVVREIVGSWNRLYAITLNKMRADALDAAVAADYGVEIPPMEYGKAVAGLINTATGRAHVKAAEKYVEALNGIAWSPRKRLSDIMLAVGQPLLQKQPWKARQRVIKEYARSILGSYIAGQLLSLLWGPPEKDSRSAMFLQWRIPGTNTYVSPFGPLPKVLSIMRQIWSGEKKTKRGEVVPIRGEGVPFGGDTGLRILERYGESGLAPGPRFIVDAFLTGEDFKGDPTTFAKALAESITPISPKDIYQAMLDIGAPESFAVSAWAFFGGSVNTHDKQAAGPVRREPVRRSVRR